MLYLLLGVSVLCFVDFVCLFVVTACLVHVCTYWCTVCMRRTILYVYIYIYIYIYIRRSRSLSRRRLPQGLLRLLVLDFVLNGLEAAGAPFCCLCMLAYVIVFVFAYWLCIVFMFISWSSVCYCVIYIFGGGAGGWDKRGRRPTYGIDPIWWQEKTAQMKEEERNGQCWKVEGRGVEAFNLDNCLVRPQLGIGSMDT